MKDVSTAKKNKYEIDMCNGPLFVKIIVFAIPLMLSGILQPGGIIQRLEGVVAVAVGQFARCAALLPIRGHVHSPFAFVSCIETIYQCIIIQESTGIVNPLGKTARRATSGGMFAIKFTNLCSRGKLSAII